MGRIPFTAEREEKVRILLTKRRNKIRKSAVRRAGLMFGFSQKN